MLDKNNQIKITDFGLSAYYIQNPNINNQNANNQNVINPNIPRHHYKPKEGMSILPIVEQSSTLIDKNEVNEINNIVQQVYTFSLNPQNGDYMTDIICRKIKHKLFIYEFLSVYNVQNINHVIYC